MTFPYMKHFSNSFSSKPRYVWGLIRNLIVLQISFAIFIKTLKYLTLHNSLLSLQGCHSFHGLKIEEIWRGITNIFEVCQNLAQNLRRIEEISHMHVLVNLTFTEVMSSNITVYSRRNTTLTVGEKWKFYMKLCNLHHIILTIWTYIICKWTNTLSH